MYHPGKRHSATTAEAVPVGKRQHYHERVKISFYHGSAVHHNDQVARTESIANQR
jgi:hypothetical protein